MDYKVLLLTLFITTVMVTGQTTQTPPLGEQDPTEASSEDSSTEASSSPASTEEDAEEAKDEDLKSSATAARYTFTQADARTSLSPAPTNELVTDDDEDEDDEEDVETMAELEKILEEKSSNDDKNADFKTTVDVRTKVTTTDNDDDDDDDDDDEDGDDEDEDNTKPASESLTEPRSSQLRRLGDLQPGPMTDGSDLDSEDKTPESPNPAYLSAPLDPFAAPQLQLTQGGYQPPDRRFFGLHDQRQRMRAGSASQQSETLEAPQAGPVTPQAMPPYQPQSARPMFQQQNPFALPGGVQNGFFNNPTAGFADFSSPNFQSPFHPADNGPYSAYPNNQNGFSLFQTAPRPNQGVFHPNLPYQQPIIDGGNGRPVQHFFHPGDIPALPNMDIINDVPRPNYSPFMRPQQAQFSVNPNFYGSRPNTDFPNARQQFQPPMYRYPNNPLTLSDQVEKKKQDGAPDEAKVSLATSQDKENPTAVPFGARIKPGSDDSGPSEVYLRYPIQDAGYATEENLPVQNTTEKSRNSDPSNPLFPFFAQPDDFRSFSNPDPYRNALNALQQGYPDDSNQTREVPADPFSNNSPVQFDDRLSGPAMMFPPYQREQVFQNRPFVPMPGMDARNPFYQLPGVQDNGFLYPPRASMREDSKKTPSCAQGNSTVCFEDADYPRRELMYAMNSDSFFVKRLSSPNQVVEAIVMQDQKESDEEGDNSICKSELKYGLPLRAKSVKESWKVIVNVENTQFIQPVRLEICKDANQPCSFTQVKTACVQKYSLQRLLSWSPAMGIHTDVFRLPIACSCQVVDAKA